MAGPPSAYSEEAHTSAEPTACPPRCLSSSKSLPPLPPQALSGDASGALPEQGNVPPHLGGVPPHLGGVPYVCGIVARETGVYAGSAVEPLRNSYYQFYDVLLMSAVPEGTSVSAESLCR